MLASAESPNLTRKKLTILAAVVVVLACLATTSWIRSFFVADVIARGTATHVTSLKSIDGDVVWTRIDGANSLPAGWLIRVERPIQPERELVNSYDLLTSDTGFYRYIDFGTPTSRIRAVAVPFWWWTIALDLLAITCVVGLLMTRPKPHATIRLNEDF